MEYGYVSTLGAQFYQSTASLDKAYTLKPMQYRLTIPYRVQLSTSNGVQADSGVVDADVLHSLQLTRAFGENDPLKIIGAAKVKELVWHEDAFAIGFNFGLLTSLVKLDMSVEKASGYRNGSFMASTNGMLLLEEVNMRNNRLAPERGQRQCGYFGLELAGPPEETGREGYGADPCETGHRCARCAVMPAGHD